MRQITLIVVLGLLSLSGRLPAQVKSPLSPSLYYEIGGGESFTRPLNDDSVGVELGIDADLRLPLSCDIWDAKHLNPEVWGNMIGDYIEGEINELGKQIVAQLTQFGQGIAVAALQRALPGLYDYSQNLNAQVSAKIDIAKRSCEDVVNDINQGINPLDAWKRIGVAVGWRSTLTDDYDLLSQTGRPASILSAQQDVAQRGTSAPIPWFGGPAGDQDRPINVVEDLVTAGYNLQEGSNTLGEAITADGTVDVPTAILGDRAVDKRLAQLWADSDEAVEWASQFLGEQTVYTCEAAGCDSSMDAGVGLAVLAQQESLALTQQWQTLLANDGIPDVTAMQAVSSATVMITPRVFEAIGRFEPQDQDVYIGRLISDVALARTIERAMAIRQLIRLSSRSPIVQVYVQAREVADTLLVRIREEIEDILWSVNTEAELASAAAQSILAYDTRRTINLGQQVIGNAPFVPGQRQLYDRPVE